ncbi:MAG TPA: TIM barrel protein [Tepidisphaeraceae bacterium]|jgi:hydroxypyruvate isomerase|nr:TIM barrel protein [Tepidisphaeraceae bacterium]
MQNAKLAHDDGYSFLSRRNVLTAAAATVAAIAAPTLAAEPTCAEKPGARAEGPAATRGNIKQSLVHWCYSKYWNEEAIGPVAKGLGCASVELIDPKHWDTLKKAGLTCAIAGSHGFTEGMNNPKYQEKCIETLRTRIDECSSAGVPSVITFTGMRDGIPDDVGMDNCVKAYKKIVGWAEAKRVTICLEMLNSRVNATMKGHPGYQGDHTDYCIELIKRVGSERLKLLFDIYHVQIMDGDVINRIKQHKDYIGHVHTAGNPGRGELDDKQEINYPPIMRALLDVGYKGYVGQEFIPTRDPLTGLREAVALCDV